MFVTFIWAGPLAKRPLPLLAPASRYGLLCNGAAASR
jgi:hypothetical protein